MTDSEFTDIVLNAIYFGRSDGSGTVTDAIMDACKDIRAVHSKLDPTRRGRLAFRRKVAYEMMFRRHPARLRLHPYLACAIDRRAAIIVLDALGAMARGTGWLSRLARQSIMRADRVATISHSERERLSVICKRDFAVLTPYPAREFFLRSRHSPEPVGRVLRIGYWGGWHDRKGIVNALSEVIPSKSVEFYVTGTPRPDLAHREDIKWLGRLTRSQLVALVDHIHIAIYPSFDEGFGLPPYEALLRGKPVVIRELPCYSDFLTDFDRPGIVRLSDDVGLAEVVGLRRGLEQSVDPVVHLRTPNLQAAQDQLRRQVLAWLRG